MKEKIFPNNVLLEAVRQQIFLTTFIGGLDYLTSRWEVDKSKNAGTTDSFQGALETVPFLEVDGVKIQTSSVNDISTETTLKIFTAFVLN